MIKVSDLFRVTYGINLELNALKQDPSGIPFVSRTTRNNGVSAHVERIDSITPIPAGTISVAAGGSVMASFLQPWPYYSGRDLYFLTALRPLTDAEKLYYCACLRANKYRYNYGRQANRTLGAIPIPSPEDLPSWTKAADVDIFAGADARAEAEEVRLVAPLEWKLFRIGDLFNVRKGKRLTKADMRPGSTPFIGAIDHNNGLTAYINRRSIHRGNTLTVNYNGNGVAEAFYQAEPFWATDDVNVLYPRFDLTPLIAMFIATIIRQEKYRFNYGRKWHKERMEDSLIRLPAKKDSVPDYGFMERYIRSLRFSSAVCNDKPKRNDV